ncbi:MAG: Bpu10I family restriction endonuclease [Armatimonadota bacterium]|nr:Bpu10I family restriction endonuclease [Armatimonadota bacterium]
MISFPTPHLEKLNATLENEKLPSSDKLRIKQALDRYYQWIDQLKQVEGCDANAIRQMVAFLNDYRLYLDIDVIFDSENDFLHRQKGQLKLDNSVIEEFLPHLAVKCLGPQIFSRKLEVGPSTSLSSVYFNSSLNTAEHLSGFSVRTKNQDFAICLPLYLKASHTPDFAVSVDREARIAYVAAECKTNLDKTMFQEACATAHDVKCAVTGAKYFLLCEWLDMTPVSTAPTDIDEVIILRKAKRVNSNVRHAYSTFTGRQAGRQIYKKYLLDHPLSVDMFERFIEKISRLIKNEDLIEDDVLELGYF